MVIIRKKHKETAAEKELREKKEQEKAMGLQDQYQARGFELVSWVQDNKVLVSCVIVAFLLGGAVLSGYLYYRQRTSELVSTEFLEAIKPLENESKAGEEAAVQKKALADLMKVVEAHKSSNVATLAGLYAAHLALENNEAQRSMELYRNALKNLHKDDTLYIIALIGLGYAQEQSGDAKAALASFENMLDLKDTAGKDLALWEAARIANELHETEKSKKYVAKLLEEYPASVYEKSAKQLKEVQ